LSEWTEITSNLVEEWTCSSCCLDCCTEFLEIAKEGYGIGVGGYTWDTLRSEESEKGFAEEVDEDRQECQQGE
jgi:hypothetical protein